jgi:O-antigen ligase
MCNRCLKRVPLLQVYVTFWIGFFSLISFVPTYYLPPFLVLSIGGLDLALGKYLPLFASIIIGLLFVSVTGSVWIALRQILKAPLAFLLGVNLIVRLLSLFKAEYVLIGGYKWLYFGLTGPFIYLLSSQLSEAVGLRIIRSMVAVGAVVASYGILEFLLEYNPFFTDVFQEFNPYYSGPGRMSATIGNYIALGSYLAALLPMALALTNRRRKAFGHFCTVLIAVGILLTFSRSAWMAFGVIFAIFSLKFHRTIFKWAFQHRHEFAIGALCFLLIVPVIGRIGGPRLETIPGQTINALGRMLRFDETEKFRLAQYRTSVEILIQSPVFGLGFGNFTRLFDEYKAPETPESEVKTTDNMYLMVACEQGIAGILAFGALLTSIWWRFWQRFLHSANQDSEIMRLAFLASYSAMLVNMVFWDALNFPAIRILFWLILGLGMASNTVKSDSQ